MRTKLPSMTGFLAFEAAARHLSFTRAAVELNLTQTAISHQIRNMESILGTKLFQRQGSMVALTPTAQAYLKSVRSAILEISTATRRIAENGSNHVLTVQCLGTFAIKRLLPRLHEFRSRHGDILLRINTVQSIEESRHYDFDVAIWYGNGNWPDMTAVSILPEDVFPVCSPHLTSERGRSLTLQDLTRFTAIRTASRILRDEWPFWLEAAGARDLQFRSEIFCDSLITSLEAAIDGLGIMMARSSVTESDLATGRLVAPFPLRLKCTTGYYIVSPERNAELEKVSLFREWLLTSFGSSKLPPRSKSLARLHSENRRRRANRSA